MSKGISPIIASVFLIVFTVTIATLALNWFSGYTSDITSTADTTKTSLLNCSKISPRITDVFISVSGQTVRATITNVGSSTLTLRSVTAYSTDGSSCNMTFAGNANLDPGDIITATATSCTIYSTNCPNFDSVVLATTCSGVGHTFKGTPTCK